MSDKISANICRGTATSAIWKMICLRNNRTGDAWNEHFSSAV